MEVCENKKCGNTCRQMSVRVYSFLEFSKTFILQRTLSETKFTNFLFAVLSDEVDYVEVSALISKMIL